MKWHNILLSNTMVAVVFSLTACSSWQQRPQLNPHPKYYLTLKGHIAKELRDKIQLRFIQGVAGLSDKCTHVTNHLEGITGNPIRYYPYLIKPDANGNYEIKVPLDKYLPGYCDWQPWAMGITLTDEEYHGQSTGYGFVSYSNKEPDTKSPRIYNYFCPMKINSDTGDDCDSYIKLGKEIPNYVKTDQSTSITVNINYKRKKHA